MTEAQRQKPRDCSAPGCAHAHDLQCALMSIASGGTQRVRVHRRGRGVNEVVLRELDTWPGLWEELQTMIVRLHRFGGSSGSGGRMAETPVPYHRHASDVAHRMRNTVSTWARAFADEHPHLTLPPDYTPAIARWLATFPTLLVEHPASDEMDAGIRAVVRDAERVIDRAPDRVYAGPCLEPLTEEDEAALAANPHAVIERCPGHLYAKVVIDKDNGDEHTQGHVQCRDCGARHVVAERQAWLSRQLAESNVTAAEAAPVLSWMVGKDIKVDTIHKWRTRAGRLVEHGSHLGRPLYRFADLEVLAREVRTRERKPKGEATRHV